MDTPCNSGMSGSACSVQDVRKSDDHVEVPGTKSKANRSSWICFTCSCFDRLYYWEQALIDDGMRKEAGLPRVDMRNACNRSRVLFYIIGHVTHSRLYRKNIPWFVDYYSDISFHQVSFKLSLKIAVFNYRHDETDGHTWRFSKQVFSECRYVRPPENSSYDFILHGPDGTTKFHSILN